MSQSSPSTPVVRGAQVTTEDGGRLNAFRNGTPDGSG
jgi:hypothetical protein